MLPVVWTESAEGDLLEIISYIAERNALVARGLYKRIRESVVHISEHPYLFRESEKIPGLREIVAHPNYLVFYRVMADRVQVEMIAHSRRKYPITR